MTARKTMSEALRDARAKALFGKEYGALTVAQRNQVEELMQRSSKYARANSE